MSTPTVKSTEAEHDRQCCLDEMEAEYGPTWRAQYQPGSFGCHELLDRTLFAAEWVERYVLSHPSCAQNQEWFALADQAVTALQTLYQRIGEVHLDEASDSSSPSR